MINTNKNDIEELILESRHQIVNLEQQINTGKYNKVLLKNLLENMRSILDFIAVDISKILKNGNKIVYFPYGFKKTKFDESVNRNLPEFQDKLPKVYSLIEKRQSYYSKNPWINDLCKLVIIPKHNHLTKQEKDNLVKIDNLALINFTNSKQNVTFNNCSFNDQKLDDVIIKDGEITVLQKKDIGFELTTLEMLSIGHKRIEILPFILECHRQLNSLKDDVYCILTN